MRRHGRTNLLGSDQDMPDNAVTLEGVLDDCVIRGTPDEVADERHGLRDEVGDLDTLLHAGEDWADPAPARRSLVLLAGPALPRVDDALPAVAAQ